MIGVRFLGDESLFPYIAGLMEKIDLQTFPNKYEGDQLRRIRSSDGETLLNVAGKKSFVYYVKWLTSIGVPG